MGSRSVGDKVFVDREQCLEEWFSRRCIDCWFPGVVDNEAAVYTHLRCHNGRAEATAIVAQSLPPPSRVELRLYPDNASTRAVSQQQAERIPSPVMAVSCMVVHPVAGLMRAEICLGGCQKAVTMVGKRLLASFWQGECRTSCYSVNG